MTEIADADSAVQLVLPQVVHEHIVGLQIAVQHATLVYVMCAGSHSLEHMPHLGRSDHATAAILCLMPDVCAKGAREPLQDDHRDIVQLHLIDELDHVWMVQFRQ